MKAHQRLIRDAKALTPEPNEHLKRESASSFAYEGFHGAHVALLLRRWRRVAEAHPHFVGLSATLADAPRFFAELVGIGPGDVAEVWPEAQELRGAGAEYMLALRGDPLPGQDDISSDPKRQLPRIPSSGEGRNRRVRTLHRSPTDRSNCSSASNPNLARRPF